MMLVFLCERNINEVKFEKLVVTVTGSSWKPRYGEMRNGGGRGELEDDFLNQGEGNRQGEVKLLHNSNKIWLCVVTVITNAQHSNGLAYSGLHCQIILSLYVRET